MECLDQFRLEGGQLPRVVNGRGWFISIGFSQESCTKGSQTDWTAGQHCLDGHSMHRRRSVGVVSPMSQTQDGKEQRLRRVEGRRARMLKRGQFSKPNTTKMVVLSNSKEPFRDERKKMCAKFAPSHRNLVVPPPRKLSPGNFGQTRTPDNFGGDNFGRTGPPQNFSPGN